MKENNFTEKRNSPCSVGHRNHSVAACSRTAAAPRAPASHPRAGPAAGQRHLLTRESASGGRNLSAGSSDTLMRRRGIATSFSASRAERTSSRKASETVSSVDRGSAPARQRGPNHRHPRWNQVPLITGVKRVIEEMSCWTTSSWISYDSQPEGCQKNI